MPVLLKGPKRERRKFTGDPEDFRLTLVEHLEELRDRVLRSLAFLVVGWIIGWVNFKYVYDGLRMLVVKSVQPVLQPGIVIRERLDTLAEAFMLKLHFSFMIGLALVFPLIVLQLWGFIEPGLRPQEAKPLKRVAPASVALFLTGVGFAWMVLPSALRWFGTYFEEFPGAEPILHAGTMVTFVVKLLLAFGIAFQLPLVVFILGALNLLTAETLMKYWRHAVTAIFIIAMIITPSNDPATMLAMAVPLVVLFMISVFLIRIVQRRKAKKNPPEPEPDPKVEELFSDKEES
jgi:sec-independent protein translocase protein TatC